MVPFGLIALAVGLLCGLRISFVVFLPASVCIIIPVIAEAAFRGASFGHILLATALAFIGLQAGYVGGLIVRAFWPVPKKRQAGSKPSSPRSKR